LINEIIQVSSFEKEAQDEINNGHQNERRHKLNQLLDNLETLARQIALIDSDHRMGNRFEP
jgi:hypothetical protein